MAYKVSIFDKRFRFRFDARTSRGQMTERRSWFMKVEDPATGSCGYGEAAPLPGLSIDDRPDFELVFRSVGEHVNTLDDLAGANVLELVRDLVPKGFPSVFCAVETALLDLQNGGRQVIFNSPFVGGQPIPINGLIWMGDHDFMLKQVKEKIELGYTCLKLKVGAIDFNKECEILSFIRSNYNERQLMLRLDANGAFRPEEALKKLDQLSTFDIHSIEQPIRPGSEKMKELCRHSPIPIALDEELIGAESDKARLIERLQPAFIILKPSLHGGFRHCSEWIREAEARNTGWWITSALESNVGLNAICQYTSMYPVRVAQGLGTGSLYHNNIPAPLLVENGFIKKGEGAWDFSVFNPS